MRYPWANTILLVLVLGQLATGFGGLVNGSENRSLYLWIHGIGAYAIVLILFWKGSVVFNSLDHRRRMLLARVTFLIIAAFLLATLGSGLLWSFGGRRLLFQYSLITFHIVLAIGVAVLLVWHVSYMRFIFRVESATDRRAFLRFGAVALAGLTLWQFAGWITSALDLPGARRRFTGSYETGSLTGDFPVVIWLSDRTPLIDADSWRLTVDGLVERPMVLSYQETARLATGAVTLILDCTGGWYSSQRWTGVRVGDLLEAAGVKAGARSVFFESATGYWRRYSVEEARGCLLATQVAGKVLDASHGFPVRLVAPEHRGFDWVKWVTRIQVSEIDPLAQPPVPLQ